MTLIFNQRQEKREKPDDLDSQSEALPLYVSISPWTG